MRFRPRRPGGRQLRVRVPVLLRPRPHHDRPRGEGHRAGGGGGQVPHQDPHGDVGAGMSVGFFCQMDCRLLSLIFRRLFPMAATLATWTIRSCGTASSSTLSRNSSADRDRNFVFSGLNSVYFGWVFCNQTTTKHNNNFCLGLGWIFLSSEF